MLVITRAAPLWPARETRAGGADCNWKRARRPQSCPARNSLGLVSGPTCSQLRRDPLGLAAQEQLGRAEAGWAMLPGPAGDG
mmetsp:Transcript_86524/g.172700  ORF Transcript_86524/g.172700 Transcript_86524/m.172700 type:complete len:82 (+) Transcript_86524:1121-1366(+)